MKIRLEGVTSHQERGRSVEERDRTNLISSYLGLHTTVTFCWRDGDYSVLSILNTVRIRSVKAFLDSWT